MDQFKRLAALMIALPVALSSTAQLAASALSVEEYVQNAITIAEDDSHGYSQIHRWGPDYDCSSMVITSLNQAGFDTGGAIYTGNMIPGLTYNGFEWIPWDDLNGLDDLRRGDILLNEECHTEIYLGRDTLVGARGEYGHPDYGDHNGEEIRISPFYDYPWDGVLRYKYDVPTSAPSEAEVFTYGSDFAVGESVYFSIFSINAKKQTLQIKKDGVKFKNINVTNKYHYSFTVDEAGVYTYSLTASNDLGSTTSKEGSFKVYSERPSGLYITADTSLCAAGDPVTFRFTSENATQQDVMIDDWGQLYDVTGKKWFTKTFDYAGSYNYALTASNPVGQTTTPFGTVIVYDCKPEALEAEAESQFAAEGSYVGFRVSSQYAAEQYLEIAKDGQTVITEDVTGRPQPRIKLDEAGEYRYRLTAKNKFGETSTEWQELTIYNSAPENAQLTISGDAFAVGEDVTFTCKAENAELTELVLESESGREERITLDGTDSLTKSFTEAGIYNCSLRTVNRFGETYTVPIHFTVFAVSPMMPTLSADKDSYTVGEYANFTFDAGKRDKLRMKLIIDGEEYENIDVTGRWQYMVLLKEPGEYAVKIFASNPCGTTRSDTVKFTVKKGPEIIESDYRFVGWEWDVGLATAIFELRDDLPEKEEPADTPDTPDSPDTPDTPDSPETSDTPDDADKKDTSDEPPRRLVLNAETESYIYDPACEREGEAVFNARITFGGETYTDQMYAILLPGSHTYALSGWRRNAANEAEAVFNCTQCENDEFTVAAKVERTVNEAAMTVDYMASAEYDGKTFVWSFSTRAGLIGDIDGDGKLTANDALLTLRVSAAIDYTSEVMDALGDTDTDAVITSADALDILRSSTGLPAPEILGTIKEIG